MKDRIHRFEISPDEAQKFINYARDALEVYTKEGQKMDVGSVDDVLNMKGGVFVELESTGTFGRVRGNGAIFDNQSFAESIIHSVVYAASNRSIGSEISRNEITKIAIKIAPITEIKVTDDPKSDIDIGKDVPIITDIDTKWIYPTDSIEYNWSASEYLSRTCKKSDIDPEIWQGKDIVLAKTTPLREKNSGKEIEILDD